MLQSMGSQRDRYDLVTEQQPGVQWLRLCFHCRGCGFDPWLVGVLRSHIPYARWRGQNKQTNIWKQGLRDLLVHLCSQQHYLQETNQVSVDSWQINKLGSIHTTECYSIFKKGRRFWHPLQHGWRLRTWCLVKSARHKRTNTVWFHSQEVPGGVRSTETGSRWWGPGAGREGGRDGI